jgi:predicted enzyme related to lactoylglutathione lyase
MNPKRNPVGWFELYVQDISRARTFYEKTFNTALQHLPSPAGIPIEMWAFPMEMTAPGAAGAIVKMADKDSGGGGTIIYFSCDDCAEQTELTVVNGGKIHQDKFSIGDYGYCSLVYDTEGNMIGLHSMK